MAQKHTEQGKQPLQSEQSEQKQEKGMQRRSERELSPGGGFGWGNELSPFAMMRRMFEDMDRLFEDFALGGYSRGETGMSQWWSPQIDVRRRGENLVVTCDLPGMSEKDIKVEIDNGILCISGERKQEEEEETGGVYRSERRYGSFYREIGLPEGVNVEDVDATFKNGVLEVKFKVPEQKSQTRSIPIKGTEIAEGVESGAHASESSPEPVEGSPDLKKIH